jgi:hypothetical protein
VEDISDMEAGGAAGGCALEPGGQGKAPKDKEERGSGRKEKGKRIRRKEKKEKRK